MQLGEMKTKIPPEESEIYTKKPGNLKKHFTANQDLFFKILFH